MQNSALCISGITEEKSFQSKEHYFEHHCETWMMLGYGLGCFTASVQEIRRLSGHSGEIARSVLTCSSEVSVYYMFRNASSSNNMTVFVV